MPAEIRLFRCRSDNYGVVLHDPDSGATAAIDAPEAAPIEAALQATGWKLTDILVTQHHADHTDGIKALKDKYKWWTRRCAKGIKFPSGHCRQT